MNDFRLSVLILTLGSSLVACKEPPTEASDDTGSESGSETASGDGDGSPGDGDGTPGDGDGDGTPGDGDGDGTPGDGDGDGTPGDGDGDGDGSPSECGNSIVEAGEECDDGNAVDDDECTNACTLPACGDGILQVSNDEACDDGNTDPGDTCTASCSLPGTLIWEQIIDIDGALADDLGFEVVIDSGSNIDILLDSGGAWQLAEYDINGGAVWTHPTLANDVPNLAIGPADHIALGGIINMTQGATRLYDTDGNLSWTTNVPAAGSSVLGVAVDGGGNVIAAGRHLDVQAALLNMDTAGNISWSNLDPDGLSLGPVAVDASGRIWAVRGMPLQLETYASDGTADWVSDPLTDAVYEDIAVDDGGNTYLLSTALDSSLITISKYDDTGSMLWSVDHDDPNVFESAGGIALLPGGNGVLVVGTTNGSIGESDGLIAWYDADGNSLVPDVVIDGGGSPDFDALFDVAISGSYAVAVGTQEPDTADLWIRKFEI